MIPVGRPITPSTPRSAASTLLYPTQSAALTTLVALSAGMLLTIAPLAGYVFQLAIWAAAYHYAVEVFERSANGSSTAPEFATEQDGIGWTLLILQMLFSACLWWLDARVETTALRWLGIASIAFVQPAMTMTTAMNREIGSAFQPRRVLGVASRVGSAYAVLVAAGFGVGIVQQLVNAVISGGRTYVLVLVSGIGLGDAREVEGALAGNLVVIVLGQFLAGFAWCYATVVYFHLLGATAFARSAALGYTPVPLAPLRPEDRHIPLLRRVDALVAEQDFAAAAHELGRCLASEPHASPAMHAHYRELLAKTGDQAGLIDHARSRIDALLVAGSEREALTLLRESLATDPQFRPSSAERTTQLAQAAERLGQSDLALALLRDFPIRHPRDEAIPANATTVARLLVERHSDVAGARAALQAAIDRMLPAHPDYADLQAKRNQLDQLLMRLPGNTSRTTPRKD